MRHQKKRNTALLYEFLVRHIAKCLIENQNQKAEKAVSLVKKYFAPNTPLFNELSLFHTLIDSTVPSKTAAEKVLNEVSLQYKRSDLKKADLEKSRLIKEINYSFNDENFYNYKIPNYVVYASAFTLLSETSGKKVNASIVDKVKIEERLLEHLVSPKKKTGVVETLKLDPRYNRAVYKILIKKFNDKYSNTLSEEQMKFLTKYAVFLISENKSVFTNALLNEVSGIKTKLGLVKNQEILKDSDLMKKINECRTRLEQIDFNEITEEKVLDVLQYMALTQEVV